jgi:hypothetical protein
VRWRTNLRTIAAEIDDILEAADDEGVLRGARIMQDTAAVLDRRSSVFALSLAKACGLTSHEEHTKAMFDALEWDSKSTAHWEPKGATESVAG